jgi:hypothetical protein
MYTSDTTALTGSSQLMVDKVSTVPRATLPHRVGRLSDSDVAALDRALVVFLGLAVWQAANNQLEWRATTSSCKS